MDGCGRSSADRSSINGNAAGAHGSGDGFEAARVMSEATRVMSEAAVRELGSPRVTGLTHAQLEDFLAQQYRQLLQDLLDLKAIGKPRVREAT